MRVLGIYREREFSPGKVDADAGILDAALGALSACGVTGVVMAPEEFIAASAADFDLILAMCQGEAALRKLAAIEERGAIAINPARAIRRCYRDRLGEILAGAGVPVPPGQLRETTLSLAARPLDGLDPACGIYVKRGDLHALSADDVIRARDAEELELALATFAARGVSKAYLQQAVQGTVIKFYGVSGIYFAIAADEPAIAHATAGLKRAAVSAAEALELQVWGGDAVIEGERVTIIDFNDWPSFSAVRTEAAAAIARRALALIAARRRLEVR